MSVSPSLRSSRAGAYWHIFRTASREDRANPMRVTAAVAVAAFRVILIIAIYKVAYGVYSHSSLSYANAMWSIALYFSVVVGIGARDIFVPIDRDVKNGTVETALIKPLGFRLRHICMLFGKNTVEMVASSIALFVILALVVGAPDLSYASPLFVLGYILILILSLVAMTALFIAVGLTAFWIHDGKPVYRIFHKLVLVFGGAYVPVALLPDAVQNVVRYSPFGMYAASTQLFNPGLVKTLWPTLIAALFWTAVTVVVCNWVWKRASERIEVNGG